ncbi:MAG: hypothetical protein Q7U35_05185 [Methanobacteriaceae archaeon]|nr:hypothetical protein [Methanobacteriaceae archaeon]MDP2835627.1 hypothetical protein [Methanobacteriaceae archaeon]MDP3033774.1 hypothetical protein [Methanobacteriaceae archaeon]MDP3483924.1 hypothetical protein [Methanobacteriaceae archaeon]MDP3624858.1 hypothetical protein [Methanobacteriaceae archaeon]
MKNRTFLFALIGIIIVTEIITLFANYNFSQIALFFSYFAKNSFTGLIYLILLNIVVFVMSFAIFSSLDGWVNNKGVYSKINFSENPQILLICIVTTLSFNILGYINYFILNTSIINSIVGNLWLGFLLLALTYLMFSILILVKKPYENRI